MKNFYLLIGTFFLCLLAAFPLGYVINSLILHGNGVGIGDIGVDTSTEELFVGMLFIAPPLIAPLIYKFFGSGNAKWIWVGLFLAPSFILSSGIYILLPLASFVISLLVIFVANYFKRKIPVEPTLVDYV